jgi:hypothetical protein
MVISVEGKVKNQLEPGQDSMGDTPVLSHCYLLKISLTKTDQCAGALVKETPHAASPFFTVFP